MTPPLLELKGIRKEFQGPAETLRILEDINLNISAGETVAITGPSGSGKSTLLGIMAGLEKPSTGEIHFSGEAIHALSEDRLASWRRDCVGFVFQNFRLLENLTALENVILPLEILGTSPDESETRALKSLEECGVAGRRDHFPYQLSGGEQQRVAIARAFVHNPRIIFADEPTGSLDGATAEAVLEGLLSINRDRGTALVLVTHNASIAKRMTRSLNLQRGRVAVE